MATINEALGEHFKTAPIQQSNSIDSFINATKNDSSLKDDKTTTTDTTKVDDTATDATKADDAKLQEEEKQLNDSFSKFLEKKGGKFKSYDEIEKLTSDYELTKAEVEQLKNTPKVEFKSEVLKKLHELDQKGVNIDTDLLALQLKDYDKMNPVQIKKEAMRLKDENKTISDLALEMKLQKEYAYNDWKDKEEEDFTDEDKANREIFFSDAERDKQALLNLKSERLLLKQPNPQEIAAAKLEAENRTKAEQTAYDEWVKDVESNISPKSSKLEIPIEYKGADDKDVKENFVYEFPKEDIKNMSDVMKQMPKDIGQFWKQFQNEKGEFNHNEVMQAVLLKKNLSNIIKLATQDGVAKGRALEVAIKKNINFTTDGIRPEKPQVNTMQEAFRQSVTGKK